MPFLKRSVLLLCALLLAAVPASLAQDDPGFVVIIHAENPTSELSRKELIRIFMKKVPSWDGWEIEGDKVKVIPIDQQDTEARQAFSKAVHGKSVTAIERYWQTVLFSGRGVPPDKYSSDAEVLAFVRANPGAIGYVSSRTTVAEGVKELRINGE